MAGNNKRILPDLSSKELLERLIALEAENEALKASSGSKEMQVNIISHPKDPSAPMLQFTGNFVPFTISVQKAQRLVKMMDKIEVFANTHGKKL